MKEKKLHISPGRVLLFSYLFVIAAGTFLLYLPQSQLVHIPLIDIFFTSASCTCVTGLKVVPVSYFTTFGQAVLLCLMQLGGIGLMTLSLFFISLFLNLGMATQMMAGEMFEFKWSRIKMFIAMIVGTTFITELLAAAYFYFPLRKFLSTKMAIFYALFHSISAFCNTGLTLFENGFGPLQGNIPFLTIIAFLIFMGSIGFVVWFEVAKRIRYRSPFSLHTKIVLSTTAIIILFGTVLTWLLERNNSLQNVPALNGLFASFFNTVSLRSAGFEMFQIGSLMPATLLVFLVLMYIGGSPGSIGGGIKTTTLALFVATMATIVRNRDEVEIFGRRIRRDQVYRAISIIVLSAAWIFITTFALLIIEHDFSFIQVLFEVVSALSLCGLHTTVSASFSNFGKVIIIFTMLIGRIGSLTLVFALWSRKKKRLYHYPDERIVIG
jgi:trk system potassium uptake protein TrkH